MADDERGEPIQGEMDPARVLDSRIRDLERELEEDRVKREGAVPEDVWWLDRLLGLFRGKKAATTSEPEQPQVFSDEERAEKEALLRELRAQSKVAQMTKGRSGSK